MAPPSYKITIRNNFGDVNNPRNYSLYSAQPEISGHGVKSTSPVVWYQTPDMSDSSEWTFKYTPEYYGFVGISDGNDNLNLQDGNEINLIKHSEVKVGEDIGMGTRLIVEPAKGSVQLKKKDDGASEGTIEIRISKDFQPGNSYVVGLARKHLQDNIAPLPVAAVGLRASARFILKPKPEVYITNRNVEAGRVDTQGVEGSATSTTAVKDKKIEFIGAKKEAIVKEDSKGDFTVTYR
ncbi:MAG: hypothetical protein M1836_004113 [Candelina mexicana]|nr:MAG: hypothetical protein M1836_004113 [Candelina mexicana]